MEATRQTALLEAALRYAENGYPVVPCHAVLLGRCSCGKLDCKSPGKHPRTAHGLKDATTDPEQIEKWWTQWPSANVAIRTDGLLVVDEDPGSNGWATPQEHHEMAGAAIQRTPRGGRHLVFNANGGEFRPSTSKLAKNIDIRAGNGSYILVAPSHNDGNPYRWETPLEEANELPQPPAWLADALREIARKQVADKQEQTAAGGEWASGARNDRLTSLAGKLRRDSLSERAIEAALQVANAERCKPPLAESEVATIARSVGRYERGPDPDAQPGARGPNVTELTGVTCQELAAGNYEVEFLIDHTLVAGQPLLVGAAPKSLKTILCIDAAISLATALPFLNHDHLAVTEAQRVGFLSGEGGLSTLQDYARRVAESKGYQLGDVSGLVFCDRLPQLQNAEHLKALESFCMDWELNVLFFDPLYLAMPSTDANSIMAQGQILRCVNELCLNMGVTPCLIHHTKRQTGRDAFTAPELADLSWAGFSEFAGQWWMLGRRSAYSGDRPGEHELWMHVGGRAGHAALHALNITEGCLADGPRYWEVAVERAGEVRKQAAEEAAERRAKERTEREEARVAADVKTLLDVLLRYPNGTTRSELKPELGFSGDRINTAIAWALRDGCVIRCSVPRENRRTPYDGVKLASNR